MTAEAGRGYDVLNRYLRLSYDHNSITFEFVNNFHYSLTRLPLGFGAGADHLSAGEYERGRFGFL